MTLGEAVDEEDFRPIWIPPVLRRDCQAIGRLHPDCLEFLLLRWPRCRQGGEERRDGNSCKVVPKGRIGHLEVLQNCHCVLERGMRETDHPHRLLRARRERPRSRRAAEQRDELAPVHSITLSARSTSPAGTSWPIAFAVLRLMTSSNRVGCSTGRSAGLMPRSSFASCRLMMSRYS